MLMQPGKPTPAAQSESDRLRARAVWLYHVEGITQNDIAQRLGIGRVMVVRLLAEPDFAPWSFALDDGTMSGISVDLALLACEEAGLACEVRAGARAVWREGHGRRAA